MLVGCDTLSANHEGAETLKKKLIRNGNANKWHVQIMASTDSVRYQETTLATPEA